MRNIFSNLLTLDDGTAPQVQRLWYKE